MEKHREKHQKKHRKKKESYDLGEIATKYLNETSPLFRDTMFGIRNEKGLYKIGNKQITIADNNMLTGIDGEIFKGTPGLWELIMVNHPRGFDKKDYGNYARLMVKTKALHRDNNPNDPYPKSSTKWTRILIPIWKNKRRYEGEGVVVIPSDPNALLERLDLLLASKEAGHTGVRNELVSICDKLKRQSVLDPKAYKKLNSIIKK